jgi:hypothetical protein
VLERAAEQLDLGERHALEQAPVDLVGVDAGLDEVNSAMLRLQQTEVQNG